MNKKQRKLLREIKKFRMTNRTMYKELEKLLPNRDLTLELLEMAYRTHPKAAKRIHKAIISNDRAIAILSEDLCGSDA